jgi:HK97 family phage portal protein
VYRAVQIHANAAAQLSLLAKRGGVAIDPQPLLVRKPEADRERSASVEYLVTSLALTGNAFMRLLRLDPDDPASPVQTVQVLNPNGVAIRDDPTGRWYDVVTDLGQHHVFPAHQVAHLAMLRVPGTPYGLGPVQAAQPDLGGALDQRDYASGWFHTSGVPSGVLSTDQHLTATQAEDYKERWTKTPPGSVRVVGAGLSYNPVMISPKDAQFLESQQFSITSIARLFGIPASLMLAAVSGGTSQTYSNIEQDMIVYVQHSLMVYLREIEEAFTAISPRGQTVRFNTESLLRTDTLTRYQAHEIALRAGWTDVAEVRAIEGLPPRPDLTREPDATP